MDTNHSSLKKRPSAVFWLLHRGASFGWWRAAAFVMLVVLFLVDHPLRNLVMDNQTPLLTDFFFYLRYAGKFLVGFGLAAILLLFGRFINKPRLLRSGKIMFFSLLLSGLAVLIAKPTLAIHPRSMFAQRASAKSNKIKTNKIRWGRFPSGDSVVVFSIASALIAEFPYLAVSGYILGFLVGVELVYFNQHLFSDVLAGAWVAIEIASLLKCRFPSATPSEA